MIVSSTAFENNGTIPRKHTGFGEDVSPELIMTDVPEDALGTNADGSINEDYCKYCYTNGEFIDKVSMEEYIEMCSQFGAQAGMTNEEMKAYCEKLFPTLKRWKQ